MSAKNKITRLLTQGNVNTIATKLALSPGAVSAALRRGNPGHPAVQEATRMAKASGAISTAQVLATINLA